MSTSLRIAATLAALAVAPEAHADVAIREKPDHVSEAVVTVDASPSEIYAVVTDYARWPSLFSDVENVKVEAGDRHDARVRFRSRAFDHTVTVVFQNDRDRAIRFRGIKGPPGGRARGEYLLVPVDGGTRTQVTARLYLDVVGVPALFVSDRKIRSLRHAKLRADLTDVTRRFASRRESASAEPARF
jgi:uncharacterized membrane protein